MQILNVRTIQGKSHPQTKRLFLFLFAQSRGARNRVRIMSLLRFRSRNCNQLSTELVLDYKLVQHHLKILQKNNLVRNIGNNYDNSYFPSTYFEKNQSIFDEIIN